jgi:hypothetical protein
MNTHTVDLKKADGTKRMTVIADIEGNPIRFPSASAAGLVAKDIEGASVSKDTLSGRTVRVAPFKHKTVDVKYFVRIK